MLKIVKKATVEPSHLISTHYGYLGLGDETGECGNGRRGAAACSGKQLDDSYF